jgi:hypothetical protein
MKGGMPMVETDYNLIVIEVLIIAIVLKKVFFKTKK